jgi:hypothetical protein
MLRRDSDGLNGLNWNLWKDNRSLCDLLWIILSRKSKATQTEQLHTSQGHDWHFGFCHYYYCQHYSKISNIFSLHMCTFRNNEVRSSASQKGTSCIKTITIAGKVKYWTGFIFPSNYTAFGTMPDGFSAGS